MFKKVLFVLLFSCLLTGCFNFKSKDAESFKTIVEKKGFKVHNVTKQYETDLIDLAYVAYNEKSDYQIEFLSFKEIEAAKNSFQRNRAVFQSEATKDSKETSVSKETKSKYTLTTEDAYMVVSRVDKFLIYVKVDGSLKSDVDKILKDLGY